MELFNTQTILLLSFSSLFLSLSYTNAICVSRITTHNLLDEPISPAADAATAPSSSPTPSANTQDLKVQSTSTPSTGTPAPEPSSQKPDQNSPVGSPNGEDPSTTLPTITRPPSPKKADQFSAVLMESQDGGNPSAQSTVMLEMESPDGSMPSDPMPAEKPDSAVVDKILQPLMTTTDPDSAVKSICASTDNPLLCAASLTQILNGNVDAKNALKAEIQVAIKAFDMVLPEVNNLMQSSAAGSPVAKGLDVCKESYNSALDGLKSSLEAIEASDVGKRNSMLSGVVTMIGTCDDTFHGLRVASPLENLSSTLMKLSSNCLAISKLVS